MLIDHSADATLRSELLSAPGDTAIRNRGLRALRVHSPTVADRTLTSMRSAEPTYARLPKDAVAPGLVTSSNCILEACLLPHDERAGTTQWASQVGRIRAQLGIAHQAMHRAYHIGGQVLFEAFMEWAVEEEGLPHERSLLLANDLWQVIDLYDAASSAAFKEAEEEMFGGQRAGELLDALLEGNADRDSIAGVVRAWGWAEHARYAVIVQRPAGWGAPPVTQAELPVTVVGIRLVWRVKSGYAVGVAPLGDVPVAAVARALTARPGRRTGVSLVVDSLGDLGRARRLAELAVRTAVDGNSAVCLEERLPAALLIARPDLAGELCTQVLGPVLALDRVSRDQLLDTLAAWVAEGGSPLKTSAALFCHRNTVHNRLRRLERLTKRSLSVPADLVALGLALEAFRQRAAPS